MRSSPKRSGVVKNMTNGGQPSAEHCRVRLVTREDLADALNLMADREAIRSRNHDLAHRMVDEWLALCEELGDEWGLAGALQIKGAIAHLQGDIRSALSFAEAALTQGRRVGDRQRVALCLLITGVHYADLGEYDEALGRAEESLAVFRELNAPAGMAMAAGDVGVQAEYRGDYNTARHRYGTRWRSLENTVTRLWCPHLADSAISLSNDKPTKLSTILIH